MERKGLAGLAPLEGVVFLLLIVASFALSGETPSSDDSVAEVVDFWKDEEGKQVASAILAALAAASFVVFAGSVRQAVARAEQANARLASIVFGGAVMFATGLVIIANFQFVVAESADDVPALTTHTINALYGDFWFLLPVGMGLFAISTGIAALRHGALDRRLGWIALVLGIVCFTPLGFPALLAMVVWSAIAGISLYRGAEPSVRSDPPGSGPPKGGGPPPIEIPPGTGPPSPS
jgi:hypothetical protein